MPEHLFFFDGPTLERMLREAGFELVTRRYVSLTVSRGYLLDRIREILGWSGAGGHRAAWLAGSIRVNPGYDLFMLARAR